MKKFLNVMICCLFVLTLSGCGKTEIKTVTVPYPVPVIDGYYYTGEISTGESLECKVVTGSVLDCQSFTGNALTGDVLTGDILTWKTITGEDSLSDLGEYDRVIKQLELGNFQEGVMPPQSLPYATSVKNNEQMHAYLRNNKHKVLMNGSAGGYIVFDMKLPHSRSRSFYMAINGGTKGDVKYSTRIQPTTGIYDRSMYVYDMDNMIVNGSKFNFKHYTKNGSFYFGAHAGERYNNVERIIFVPKHQ